MALLVKMERENRKSDRERKEKNTEFKFRQLQIE